MRPGHSETTASWSVAGSMVRTLFPKALELGEDGQGQPFEPLARPVLSPGTLDELRDRGIDEDKSRERRFVDRLQGDR